MFGKTLIGAIGVAASVFALSACGGDDNKSSAGGGAAATAKSDAGKARKIYMNQYSQEIQYFRDKHEGFTARAKELGWEITSEYGNGTPEQQVQQVQNALTKQPEAIVITPIDAKSLEPVLRQAKQQNIPVFTVGANVSDESLYTSFIAATNYDGGKEKAEYVAKKLDGKGTVGIIHGIRGLTFSEDQGKAYKDVFAKYPEIKVVDGGYAGGFSSDLGIERTQSLLTRNPKIDGLIYDADDLTLGGIQAVQQRKIANEDIVVVSTDGAKAALDAVEAGKIDMTLSLCGYSQGTEIINIVRDVLDGKTVEKRIVSKTLGYTTENIGDLSGKPRSFCS